MTPVARIRSYLGLQILAQRSCLCVSALNTSPLDIINATGLRDVTCTAGDGTAHTWRGLKADESFWPGRLDLVSTTGFQSVHGRVFDCSCLSKAELEQLAVEPSDSAASDHLMLVVDCELRKSGIGRAIHKPLVLTFFGVLIYEMSFWITVCKGILTAIPRN